MPDSFAKSPQGSLYIANGIDAVARWDGIYNSLEKAGIVAPTEAVVLSGSGNGNIFGGFAYARFMDRKGLYSNLSPIGVFYEGVGQERTITNATNTSPIQITSAGHTLQDDDTIVVQDVEGNTAANGTWEVTVVDANNFLLNFSVGNDDYNSGGTFYQGVGTVTYSNLPVSDDPKVTKRQIFRTKIGAPNVVYLDIETEDLTSTSLSSTQSDSDLVLGYAIVQGDGDDLLATRHAPPPSDKAVLAHHIDRMFAAVDVAYTEGNVAVTNGSTTVTGIGTEWSEEFEGRYLYLPSGTKSYLISSINVETETITLSEAYDGTTLPYSNYAIRPDEARRRTVHWSEAGLPESWDPSSFFGIQENRDAGQLTGLISLDSWIYVFAENRIYRFSYQKDPLFDGFVFPDARRGMLNHRTWTLVDDAAYVMDRQGIYKYMGNGQQEITQPIQDMFEPEPDGAYKINWRAKHWFHAGHDPVHETVKFFVTMEGDYLPHHAICYGYRTNKLWIEEYPTPIGATATGVVDGRAQLFLGADHCRVLGSSTGTLDGVDPQKGTVQGTVTSSGWTWIADSSATFQSNLTNAPLIITEGTGIGQRRRILSISGTTVNVDAPWAIQPDTTSKYAIGGIEYVYHTGKFRYIQRDKGQNRRVELITKPTTYENFMHMLFYEDESGTPVTMQRTQDKDQGGGIATEAGSPYMIIDTTKLTGYVDQSLSEARLREIDGPRFISYKVAGTQVRDKIKIHQMGLYGVRR